MEQTVDTQERFQALEDEVNILKTEIKQVLVDLKEFMVQDKTVLPQGRREVQPAVPPRALTTAQAREGSSAPTPAHRSATPPALEASAPASPLGRLQTEAHPMGELDAALLGNLIWWLGTVKRRGLSLQQLAPFLETYEMSGHLTPAMAKLVLRTLSQLDEMQGPSPDRKFSPQDYTECLLQLHDILCTPGYRVDRLIAPPSGGEIQVP